MKILLIVDYYYPNVGGAETLYQKLAESLAAKHEVVVLTQQISGAQSEEVLNGVRIVRIATWHRALFPYQAFKAALSLLDGVDIIQAATYSAAVLAARLRSFTKAKVVLIVHEYLAKRWLSLGLAGLSAFFYERYVFSFSFDHYVAVSQSTKRQLLARGIGDDQVTVITNGIDSQLFVSQRAPEGLRASLGISDQAKLFLFAGRPGVTKGGELLISAWQQAQLPSDAVLLLILGSEPLGKRRKLVALAARGVAHTIKIIDSVERSLLPQYLAMADVITVPSLTEGFGFFAAEACAMHLPIVITPVDALPEVVSGRVIVSADCTIGSFAAALQAAYRNEFQSLSAKTFSWTNTAEGYLALYKRCVG